MRYNGLDLNLLIVLRDLLKTRNVSKTARQLHLSQPAISAALSRLRDHFDDRLLLPSGRKLLTTAYAETLSLRLDDFMRSLDDLLATSMIFDPSESKRRFKIIASDYITTVIFTPLMGKLQSIAPNVSFQFYDPSNVREALELGDVDLILTLDEYASVNHPRSFLLDEPHVVVGWCENPSLHHNLTESEFFEAGHVAVELRGRPLSAFAEMQMSRMGRQRRIEVISPTFSSVPWMLPGTSRLALLQERFAQRFLKVLPLKMSPVPFEFPLMRQVIQCPPSREFDPGVRWLHALIKGEASIRKTDDEL